MSDLLLAVHFETCGLPDSHSPIVLDALLFKYDGTLVDRFYCVIKPYEHFQWDAGSESTHMLSRDEVFRIGVDYKTTSALFQQFMAKYSDSPTTLVCWDAHTTAINAAYFTPNGTQYFLGCDKLPLRDAIDMKQVFKFYLLHKGSELKFFTNMPQILEKWGVVQDVNYWSRTVFREVPIPTRSMSHKLYLIFIKMKDSK